MLFESVSGENSPKTVLSLAIMIVVDLGMFYLYDRLGEAYQDKMQQRLLKGTYDGLSGADAYHAAESEKAGFFAA